MDQETREKIDEFKKNYLTKTNIGRGITKLVVRHSVSFVAATLAKTYCPTENKKQELQVTVGAYALGGMAADGAVEWASAKYDEYVDTVMSIEKIFKKNSKSSEEKPSEEPATV